jgi:hypothetical protein
MSLWLLKPANLCNFDAMMHHSPNLLPMKRKSLSQSTRTISRDAGRSFLASGSTFAFLFGMLRKCYGCSALKLL